MKSEKQIVADIITKAEQKGSGIYYGKRFAVPTGRERMTGQGCRECEMAYITKGGGLGKWWKKLKKGAKKVAKAVGPALKKGNKFLRKHKILSKALGEIGAATGNPKVILAARASKKLGYGLKPTGTGLRAAGGKYHGKGIRVAGTGNPWVAHCKRYSAKHGCSYAEALKRAKKTYKKK